MRVNEALSASNVRIAGQVVQGMLFLIEEDTEQQPHAFGLYLHFAPYTNRPLQICESACAAEGIIRGCLTNHNYDGWFPIQKDSAILAEISRESSSSPAEGDYHDTNTRASQDQLYINRQADFH
jgi:hypothetical protein